MKFYEKILLSGIILTVVSCSSYKPISDSEREKIISELSYIRNIDQEYASLPPKEMMEKYGEKNAWKVFETKRDSVGKDNQSRIKRLYAQYGYLGFKQVGEANATKFWISIQHADDDVGFQRTMLKAMKKKSVRRMPIKMNMRCLKTGLLSIQVKSKDSGLR